MKYLGRPLEVKEVKEDGTFEGLASMYGNVDLGGDVIEKGAFKEFVYTKDGQIRMFDSHNTRVPVGKGRVTDTHIGLAIAGKLNLKLPAARIVHELMLDEITDGLSIGFDVLSGGSETDEKGIRHLTGIKLWEVSPVVFPMNPEARITAVKSFTPPQFETVRECEAWLRDEVGLTRDGAKDFVARFKKAMVGVRDEPARDELTHKEDLKAALKFLETYK